METPDPRLNALLADPSSATVDDLRALAARYPFFPLPGIILLERYADSLNPGETENLRLHLALTTPDHQALYDLLGERAESFASIYPPTPPTSSTSTDSAIDTFFANYGMADDAETALLERMIFNPTPSDYSEQLLDQTPADLRTTTDPDSLESRIDAFVRDHAPADTPSPAPKPADAPRQSPKSHTPAPAHDDSLLSESLAKIFIKQGRYERAYEIISNLSLNYPKKSIYFADQLRFLQKLIRIKQSAEHQKS